MRFLLISGFIHHQSDTVNRRVDCSYPAEVCVSSDKDVLMREDRSCYGLYKLFHCVFTLPVDCPTDSST